MAKKSTEEKETKKSTAKKTTTKKKTVAKKEKTPDKHAEYSEFIKTVVRSKVEEKLDWIIDICSGWEDIEPVSAEVWKQIDAFIISIDKENDSSNNSLVDKRVEPLKRGTYGITFKVREKYRKIYINGIIDRMNHNLNEDKDAMKVHYCYLIYQHLKAWTDETSVGRK